jgi:hypothetical protein
MAFNIQMSVMDQLKQLLLQKQTIDLQGPEGNIYNIIYMMEEEDEDLDEEKILTTKSYNEIIREFTKKLGHKYKLINFPSTYK